MLIAVGIVVLLLPVMAYMGVFKAVKEEYTQVTMVELPPPPPEPPTPKAKKAHPHVDRHGGEHVAASTKPLAVHVAAVAPTQGGAGDDNTIVNGNNTNIGTVPVAPASAPPTTSATVPVSTAPVQSSSVAPAAPPVTAAPAKPAVEDQIATVLPETQVKPVIPDDLRDSDLDTQFRALFTVHADGSADVSMVQSTGNNELDQLALQAARQWRFHPAIKDGAPIESYIRLWVDFEVS